MNSLLNEPIALEKHECDDDKSGERRQSVALGDVHRRHAGELRADDGGGGNRTHGATETGGDLSNGTEFDDAVAHVRSVRNNGAVEGQGSGVAGTGDHGHEERADGGGELSKRLGILHDFNEVVGKTDDLHAAAEDGSRAHQADDFAVAVAGALEELLDGFGNIDARHGNAEDGAEEHGRRNVDVRDESNLLGTQNEDDKRNDRDQSKEIVDAELLAGIVSHLGLREVNAFLHEVGHQRQNDGGDGQAHEGARHNAGDDGHDVDLGDVGQHRVQSHARGNDVAPGAEIDGGGSHGRLDAHLEERRNQQSAHGGGNAGSGRQSDRQKPGHNDRGRNDDERKLLQAVRQEDDKVVGALRVLHDVREAEHGTNRRNHAARHRFDELRNRVADVAAESGHKNAGTRQDQAGFEVFDDQGECRYDNAESNVNHDFLLRLGLKRLLGLNEPRAFQRDF